MLVDQDVDQLIDRRGIVPRRFVDRGDLPTRDTERTDGPGRVGDHEALGVGEQSEPGESGLGRTVRVEAVQIDHRWDSNRRTSLGLVDLGGVRDAAHLQR